MKNFSISLDIMKKMMETINDVANTYQSYDEIYEQLIKTNDITICEFCLDYDGIWKRLKLKWLLDYFLKKEEYEKCAHIKEIMKYHFIGNNNKQIELNKQHGL